MIAALPRADRLRIAFKLLGDEADEITFRRNAMRWTAFPWDTFISQPLFINGGFEEYEVGAVLEWMASRHRITTTRDVIVDIGANLGTSTIPFAIGGACRVLAIEPVPEIFAALCRNVTDNGLEERVICIQAAISRSESGRVRMILPSENSGGGEVARGDREPSFAGQFPVRGSIEVPATTLTALLDANRIDPEEVALVWSDAQGCELEVIETGSPLWVAGVPLFAEFDPRILNELGAEELLAGACAHFAEFIPARTLIAKRSAKALPIAQLRAFYRGIAGDEKADALLLPHRFRAVV